MYFVWLDAVTMAINNPINIFLINVTIILNNLFSLNVYGYQ